VRGQVYPIGNFRSGLDYRGGYASAGTFAANANDPDNVPERGRAREAVNVTVDANGVLRRRKGCWTAANWAAQTWSWAYMVKNPSTVTFPRPILLAQSLDIYSATYSPYAATASIGGAFAPITSVGNFVEAAVSGGQGPLYGNVNGGTMVHWTGTGNLGSWTAVSGTNTNWSYLGSVPVGTILYYHLNRVWIATGNTLYWSDIGDPRVWPTQNVIKLDPDDGDQITGLAKLGTNLIVFKRKKIYLIYDDVTGYNRTISTTIGANAPKSIAETPQGIMFMDRNSGPCVTDGKNVTVLGDPVMPALYTYYDSDRTQRVRRRLLLLAGLRLRRGRPGGRHPLSVLRRVVERVAGVPRAALAQAPAPTAPDRARRHGCPACHRVRRHERHHPCQRRTRSPPERPA
jgi:hypothetical protein